MPYDHKTSRVLLADSSCELQTDGERTKQNVMSSVNINMLGTWFDNNENHENALNEYKGTCSGIAGYWIFIKLEEIRSLLQQYILQGEKLLHILYLVCQ